MTNAITRALTWIGRAADEDLLERLAIYREWLTTEAMAAGGIGPEEAHRIDSRHLADSLVFAGVWDGAANSPILDVGSGVGLPGIPLALAVPDRRFVLLDRSGRRTGLLRRALRILELDNVDVVETDISAFEWTEYTVVARASLPAAALFELTRDKGLPRELLVGGSHRTRPEVTGFVSIEIPAEILAWPAWILRMGQ